MRDYGHHDPGAGGTKPFGLAVVAPIVFGLALVATAVALYRAPGPEDVRNHVETDAIRQTQVERERNRRYAATRKLDSLEAELSGCRLERAKLEVER